MYFLMFLTFTYHVDFLDVLHSYLIHAYFRCRLLFFILEIVEGDKKWLKEGEVILVRV